jgi:hypothetical protein
MTGIFDSWKWICEEVGIMSFVLIPMSVLSLTLLLTLGGYRLFSIQEFQFIKRFLNFIKTKVIQVGLFGTVIGVSQALYNFRFRARESEVEATIRHIGAAFSSTAYALAVYFLITLSLFFIFRDPDPEGEE